MLNIFTYLHIETQVRHYQDFILVAPQMKEIFMEEYGAVTDDEIIIEYVVSTIANLYFATSQEIFPDWAKDSLDKLYNGELLKYAKSLSSS